MPRISNLKLTPGICPSCGNKIRNHGVELRIGSRCIVCQHDDKNFFGPEHVDFSSVTADKNFTSRDFVGVGMRINDQFCTFTKVTNKWSRIVLEGDDPKKLTVIPIGLSELIDTFQKSSDDCRDQ